MHAIEHHDPVAHLRGTGRRGHGDLAPGHLGEPARRLRRHLQPARRRPDDIPEHRARLDRGQLSGVPHQHEPRLGPHRLHQARHQRQGHHRGLVDHHDVVREPVAAVMTEAAVAGRPPAEQAVQSRRLKIEERGLDLRPDVERGGLLMHGLLEPRGRLARRRGEGDQRGSRPGRGRLLVQQRRDPRDRGRLARAGPAGHDGEAPQHRRGRGQGLAVVAARGEEAAQSIGEDVGAHALGRGTRERPQVGREPALLAPVAVEVQARAEQPEGPLGGPLLAEGDQRAAGQPRHPLARVRPGQGGDVDGLVEVDDRRLRDGRQVDVDVPQARSADGEGRGQRHPVVLTARQPGEPNADVDVGGAQDTGVVEDAQRGGDAQRQPRVEGVEGELAHGRPPRSSTSLSALTSAPGGRHANTPHGIPSTRGTFAPVIPRRNR
jgi:hypothetical protein